LRKLDRQRKPYVTETDNCDLHALELAAIELGKCRSPASSPFT
jgi:hypothetical protein